MPEICALFRRGGKMQVLYRRQKTTSGGLKIKDVNSYLDHLAAAEDRLDSS